MHIIFSHLKGILHYCYYSYGDGFEEYCGFGEGCGRGDGDDNSEIDFDEYHHYDNDFGAGLYSGDWCGGGEIYDNYLRFEE